MKQFYSFRGWPWFFLLIFQCMTVSIMLWCWSFVSPVHSVNSVRGRHTALSLRVLSEKAQANINKGIPLDSEITGLGGMTHLEGYVVDKENQDVVLIGMSDMGTSMHLDDLVVNIRSIWNPTMAPYCSLEPQPGDVASVHEIATGQQDLETLEDWRRVVKQVEDHWGPQSVEIRGVPRASRHAHMMIEADYHMKKVSLGLADFTGISSYLDRHISAMEALLRSGEDSAGSSVSMVRFWFHTRQGFPTFGEEEDIVFLEACPMDVLTEKQNADPGGALSDSDQDDLHAVSFAREFSQLLDSSAQDVDAYAQLKNLFEIKAVLEAMKYCNAVADAGLDLGFYLSEYHYLAETPLPETFPGLVNHKEVHLDVQRQGRTYACSFIPMTWGGVNMEMGISRGSFRRDNRLKRLLKNVMNARPSAQTISWTFYAD